MKEELIVNKHGRARLNGPNDVVATPDALYFTDPYYALLEKRRPADAQYADDKSELGFAGIYRYDLRTKDLELLDSSLARPNGIGIVNGSHLVVSDCCQGLALARLIFNGNNRENKVLPELILLRNPVINSNKMMDRTSRRRHPRQRQRPRAKADAIGEEERKAEET